MAIFNLDAYAGAIALEIKRSQNAIRYEKHFNLKVASLSALAVGDTVYSDVSVPDWCRTVIVSKRTDTANPDVLTIAAQEVGLAVQPALPLKTSPTVQTVGSTSNSASNTVQMQCYPIGATIRLSLQIANSLPSQAVLSIAMYDY